MIHYTVTAADDGSSAVFLGDAEAGQQRLRLIYTLVTPGRVKINFEMAPPDHPNQFQRFIEGKLHRFRGDKLITPA